MRFCYQTDLGDFDNPNQNEDVIVFPLSQLKKTAEQWFSSNTVKSKIIRILLTIIQKIKVKTKK
jgi:hypothetical protein